MEISNIPCIVPNSRQIHNKRTFIERICPKCNKTKLTRLGDVKRAIKTYGTYRGRCRKCGTPRAEGARLTHDGYLKRSQYDFTESEQLIIAPMLHNNGQILEHRALVAIKLNRPLTTKEVIRHLDGNKQNNALDNLAVGSQADNVKDHMSLYEENRQLKQRILELENGG